MTDSQTNICTRCGKVRISSRTWTEEVEMFFGKSVIKHTETVCPDVECQKIVDEKIESQRKKTEELKKERDKRLLENQKKRKAN